MDPLEQPISPAPASPEGVPGIPSSESEMSEGEMRTNLQNVMAKLKDKYSEFDNQKFVADAQKEKRRSEALSELFTLFESKGINPEKPEEIKAYLDKVRETNPEIASQIEAAISNLLGEEEVVEPEDQSSENMNINKDEALQQNV